MGKFVNDSWAVKNMQYKPQGNQLQRSDFLGNVQRQALF